MIRINLASRKHPVMGSESPSKGLSIGMPKLDFAALEELPLKKLGTAIAVMVAASYLMSSFQSHEVAKWNAIVSTLSNQNATLKAQVAKGKGLDTLKKQLDLDETTIRTKIDTIQKLISDRQLPPKVLFAFSSALPADVWIDSFAQKEGVFVIKGFSLGYNQISDFMKNLNESAYFQDVKLESTEESTDDAGQEADKFELSAKRR